MAAGIRRTVEVVLAAILLLAGFAALLALFGVLAAWLHPPDTAQKAKALRVGLEMAFIVISIKGLLPQLLLAAVLRPLVARAFRSGARTGARDASAVWLAAALAYAVVGPLLLTREGLGMPPLRHANALQHLGTFLSTTTGVAAAFWSARTIVRRTRSGAPERVEIG